MKNFDDMPIEELKNVFEKSENLQQKTADIYFNYICEEVNEIMNYFHHPARHIPWSIKDYNINWMNGYIKVEQYNYYNFLDDLTDLQNDYCLLSNETWKKAERLIAKVEIFDENLTGYGDMTEENWYQFETWFNNGIKEITNCLHDILESMFEYPETEILFEYFLEYYIEEHTLFLDEAGGKIYESKTEIIDRIA